MRFMANNGTVDIHADGTWSYEQDTLLIIPGQSEPFHHTDRNRLRKIAESTPNPTALVARQTTRSPLQSDFERPKNNPRRGPYCGAPTPTPVPLRIW
jgi:hypothetical protein